MKNYGGNFLNDNSGMDWTETIHGIMMAVPLVGLTLIFMFRRPLSRINPKIRRIILGTLGGLIFTLEFTQDITKLLYRIPEGSHGDVADGFKGQSLEMLELCRVNTLLLGLFLMFDKIDGIKGIAATTLFGGGSTVYDDGKVGGTAPIGGVIKHGVVLTLVPALAIAKQSNKFTLKNLGYAHIFNYIYVGAIVIINYTVPLNGNDRSIANLNELDLADNAMVGWMPFGGRIFMYVFFITLLFGIGGGIENFIHRHTDYSRKLRIDKALVHNTVVLKEAFKRGGNNTKKLFAKKEGK